MTTNELQDALVLVGLIDPDAIEDPDGYDEGATMARIDELHAMLGWFRARAHRGEDEALLRQALEALESLFSWQADPDRGQRCSTAVVALRTRLGNQPPAAVEDRLARHGIPMPVPSPCPDCHGVGYDASGQLCGCQENPSF